MTPPTIWPYEFPLDKCLKAHELKSEMLKTAMPTVYELIQEACEFYEKKLRDQEQRLGQLKNENITLRATMKARNQL